MGLLKASVIVAVLCMLMDAVWIGFVAKKFYLHELEHIGRIKNGGFNVVWWAAIAVYFCLGLGIAYFVNGRVGPEGTVLDALLVGALFGLICYGTYDMTNHATLKDFGARMAVVDVCWGTFMCGMAGAGTQYILRML